MNTCRDLYTRQWGWMEKLGNSGLSKGRTTLSLEPLRSTKPHRSFVAIGKGRRTYVSHSRRIRGCKHPPPLGGPHNSRRVHLAPRYMLPKHVAQTCCPYMLLRVRYLHKSRLVLHIHLGVHGDGPAGAPAAVEPDHRWPLLFQGVA